MTKALTLGQMIAAGFAACLALTLCLGGVAFYALAETDRAHRHLQSSFWEDRLDAEELQATAARASASAAWSRRSGGVKNAWRATARNASPK